MAQQTNTEENLNNKKLSIQIGLSGLSFCILNSKDNEVTHYKHFKKERKLTPIELQEYLEHILETEKLIGNNFDKITVVYRNELATLIPKHYFKEEQLADYLKFNNKILPTDYIAYDELENNSIVVYVPYVNINNYIFESFGSFTYKHFATLFINYIENLSEKKQEECAYVNIEDNLFEVLILKGTKILFYNTFTYQTPEDFIYYLLFTFEQLALDSNKIPVEFFGEINTESDLFKIAYKYIRNVKVNNYQSTFKFSGIANENVNPILISSL